MTTGLGPYVSRRPAVRKKALRRMSSCFRRDDLEFAATFAKQANAVRPNHRCHISNGHGFAISPRESREFCCQRPSSDDGGRRECRAHDAPAASHAR